MREPTNRTPTLLAIRSSPYETGLKHQHDAARNLALTCRTRAAPAPRYSSAPNAHESARRRRRRDDSDEQVAKQKREGEVLSEPAVNTTAQQELRPPARS